ncbi:MAG: hypothetical protein ACO24H_06250 [Polynucleobacter sp.]
MARTYWNVFAHEYGTTEFVNSYDSKREAQAAIKHMLQEFKDHPQWYDYSEAWFSIEHGPTAEETSVLSDQLDAAGL